jgi:GAF domain-containing protein
MTDARTDLPAALATLADALVTDFDFIDLAHSLARSTVAALDASAAGVMVVDRSGELQVVAASDEDTHVLEVFELQRHQGPCYDSWVTGRAISASELGAQDTWPDFALRAGELGYESSCAVPLRFRGHDLGALNVFWSTHHDVTAEDLRAAQALANLAAVGLAQQSAPINQRDLAEEVESAIHGRIAIEQAKGMLAVQAGITVEAAFDLMSAYAARHGSFVRAVAQQVVDRRVTARQMQ